MKDHSHPSTVSTISKNPGRAGIGKWFPRLCAAGLCVSLALLIVPARFKPYRVRRYWDDWRVRVELKTTEYGFGPYGLVAARHVTLHKDKDARLLDPFRRQWAIARTQPAPPSTIDTRLLQWDDWGPSCTYLPSGVGVGEVGAYICLPYSAMAIGFAILLMWWGIRRRRRPQLPL